MAKKIRLTESELISLIRNIINEQVVSNSQDPVKLCINKHLPDVTVPQECLGINAQNYRQKWPGCLTKLTSLGMTAAFKIPEIISCIQKSNIPIVRQ